MCQCVLLSFVEQCCNSALGTRVLETIATKVTDERQIPEDLSDYDFILLEIMGLLPRCFSCSKAASHGVLNRGFHEAATVAHFTETGRASLGLI